LLGRDEVDLPLGRMILEGRMARVVDGELALTAEEARAVLAALGRGDEDVDRLLEWTQGWVAGVVFQGKALAAPTVESLQDQRPNDFITYVSREIFDGGVPVAV
jgi:ATP/maltotriose-dependent transcriptional regulator MalT